MKEVQIIPIKPDWYWRDDKEYDGIYTACRFHRAGEFVSKFPIMIEIKYDQALMDLMGESAYLDEVVSILNKPPPPPPYKGRGRRPKQRPPVYGKVELIKHYYRNINGLKYMELMLYSSKGKNKRLFDPDGATKQGSLRPDGRKNRSKREQEA